MAMSMLSDRTRSYSELRRLGSLEERFRYLSVRATVASATFGSDRYLNQRFYASQEWRSIRNHVILRDRGCDLGIDGFEIHDRVYIHHMNPMTIEDIVDGDPSILDPEFLISVTLRTHNAIHYGDESQLPKPFVERRPGDTQLW
jgi:hypothetical protein